MARISEIMLLCRLCLVKGQVNIPIYAGENDVRQIFQKITACLPIKVSADDNLPKKICDGCLYKLELLYQFWNTSANAEKQLLAWLIETNSECETTQTVINTNFIKEEIQNTDDISAEAVDIGEQSESEFLCSTRPERLNKTQETDEAEKDDENIDDPSVEVTIIETEVKVGGDSNRKKTEATNFGTSVVTQSENLPGPSGLNKSKEKAPVCEEDPDNSFVHLQLKWK